MDQKDELFMTEALRLAAEAARIGEVPVGAVIVRNDKVIGRGYNLRENRGSAIAHAEARAPDRYPHRLR